MDSLPSNCLPRCVSGDERWFGFANHYIKGTVVWTRYVLVMQCLSYNHALYSAGVKIPQGQQAFDVVHGE